MVSDRDEAWQSALTTAVLLLAAAAGLVLVTGHLATWMFEHGWPRYDVADAPGIVRRVVEHPDDPAAAWAPVNRGVQPPGAVAWWAVYLLFVSRLVTLASVSRRIGARLAGALSPSNAGGWVPWRDPRRQRDGTRWASWRDQRRLRPRRDDEAAVVVGCSAHQPAVARFVQVLTGIGGRRRLVVRDRHSLLLIGPSNSGKSSAVAIPAILEWPGLVVVASPKATVIDHTIGWRSRLGDVHVFDPGDATRFRGSGWSPLEGCGTWTGARRAAQDLAAAAQAAAQVEPDALPVPVPTHAVAKALAPYLFAAALTNRKVADLAYWLDREERDDVLAELETAHPDVAFAHLQAVFRLEEALRVAVFESLRTLFEPYLDPHVARSAEQHEIVADELLDGGAHTLYVTSPYHSRERLRPICAAVLRQIVTRAYEQAAASGRPLARPALLVLDEGAAIAPTADLETVASSAALSGLQVVTLFQDVAQIQRRYRGQAAAVVNNHRAKLYLPTRFDFATVSGADGADGGDGAAEADPVPEAVLRRALLPPAHARLLAEGEGVLLYGNLAPIRTRLRPWFRNRTLRRRVELPQDVLSPAPGSGLGLSRRTDRVELPPSPAPDATPSLPPNVTRLGPRRRGRHPV